MICKLKKWRETGEVQYCLLMALMCVWIPGRLK